MHRGPVVAAFLGLWLVALAPWASAHALLESSEPADGALLDRPPAELVLRFSESPDRKLSTVHVLDQRGAAVETGAASPQPGDARTIRVPLSGLEKGVYTVSWRVLSTVDGHVTAGAFGFGVGVASIGELQRPPEEAPSGAYRPSALAIAGRWGFYWGLALLLGAAATGLVVFARGWRPPAAPVLSSWALGALGLTGMLLAERAAVGVGLGELLGSDRGRVLLLRAGGFLVVAIGMVLMLRSRRRWSLAVLGAAVAAVMLVQAYAGHAGGATSMRWLKIGVQWVHLLAVGIWIGGLAWLLVGTRGNDGPEAAASVGRFSTMATVALGAVVVTGGLRALDEVGLGPRRYLESGFGLTVLAKAALFAPLALLGALNRFRNVPALLAGRGRIAVLRRTVRGEVVIAVLIFGVTGLMAGLVPPSQPPPARAEEKAVVATGSDFGTTVRVRLRVAPGAPGANRFDVQIRDYDTGEPVQARRVTLRFSLPSNPAVGESELPLEDAGDGAWSGQGVNLAVEGAWRVGVLIELPSDSVEVALKLTLRPPPQEVTVARAPGQPALYTIALAGGRSVQAYVDPGAAGDNEVHFTFFSAEGGEQALRSWRVEAIRGAGPARVLEARELSPGHVVADAVLVPGRWRFRVEAEADDGTLLAAYFEETIGGKE